MYCRSRSFFSPSLGPMLRDIVRAHSDTARSTLKSISSEKKKFHPLTHPHTVSHTLVLCMRNIQQQQQPRRAREQKREDGIHPIVSPLRQCLSVSIKFYGFLLWKPKSFICSLPLFLPLSPPPLPLSSLFAFTLYTFARRREKNRFLIHSAIFSSLSSRASGVLLLFISGRFAARKSFHALFCCCDGGGGRNFTVHLLSEGGGGGGGSRVFRRSHFCVYLNVDMG
jgi:hypothetical protein